MPFAIPSAIKIGAVVVVLLVVGALLWTVRAELIDKGENIIRAQDNAALVKAQADQAKKDALLIASQNQYITQLENQGAQIKERIVRVSAPCVGDGATDPRLGDTVDWLRSRGQANTVPTPSGPQPQAAVPPPRLPAAKR